MQLSIRQGRKKVVLDTNILVSALIAKEGSPAKLFEMLVLGEIENYSCKEIAQEVKEVFGRKEITEMPGLSRNKYPTNSTGQGLATIS